MPADEVRVEVHGDVEKEILEATNNNRELRRALRDFVEDTKATWIAVWESSGPHPYETGSYVSHIKEEKLSLTQKLFIKRSVKQGLVGRVYNDSPIAHLIEYGTGPDRPGSHSPWGPDTPTPEFAPARKTAKIMSHKDEVVTDHVGGEDVGTDDL